MTARELARRVLERIERDKAWATPTLDGELARAGLDDRDRRLASELVYGVLRHRSRLDRALAAHADLKKTPIRVVIALRVAAYQLMFLDRVPPYAIIDDAVAAARASGGQKLAGFANAVLRKIGSQHEPAFPPGRAGIEAEYSLPRWIANELAAAIAAELGAQSATQSITGSHEGDIAPGSEVATATQSSAGSQEAGTVAGSVVDAATSGSTAGLHEAGIAATSGTTAGSHETGIATTSGATAGLHETGIAATSGTTAGSHETGIAATSGASAGLHEAGASPDPHSASAGPDAAVTPPSSIASDSLPRLAPNRAERRAAAMELSPAVLASFAARAAAFATSAPLVARANALRTTRGAVREMLQTAGLVTREIDIAPGTPQAFAIENLGDPARSPSFTAGQWTVQDSGAQLVAHLARPRAGMKILDACAGVGGKSTHLAELAGDQATIDAADRSAVKLDLAHATAQRLGITSLKRHVCDLTDPRAPLGTDYDLVVLDAPCSGLGVLRRHPDAKWRLVADDVPRLAAVQRELLDAVVTRLAPHGTLIYSVCTFTRAEGADQARAFAERSGMRLVEEHRTWPPDADAFYLARFER